MSETTIDRFRLATLLANSGLTQGQLAVKSGITQAHLSRLLAGKRTNVKVSTLQKLATALGVSVADLIPQPERYQTINQPAIDLAAPEIRVVLSKLAELPQEDRQLILDMIRLYLERTERNKRGGRGRSDSGEG